MTRPPLTVLAPVGGRVVAAADVADEVFAAEMLGPGLALEPLLGRGPGEDARDDGVVVAPVTGVVAALHPHALVVRVDEDRAVLVHLGLDTVALGGAGFELAVAVGAAVTAGAPLGRWDPRAVAAAGHAVTCPVVALQAAADDVVALAAPGEDLTAGTPLLLWR